MRCGAGPLAVLAAVFWTQCVLLDGVDAKKERKRPKEATPQHTETYNATLSNSEEVGGGVKVIAKQLYDFFGGYLRLYLLHLISLPYSTQKVIVQINLQNCT